MTSRREFIKTSSTWALATFLSSSLGSLAFSESKDPFFKISLAQWSLHRSIKAGKLTTLQFAEKAKKTFGIEAVEYVNQFFMDKATDIAYLQLLKKKADDLGVKSLLIMIDGEGYLGNPDRTERIRAVENHYKWIDAAKLLGCHSIRVNAAGNGGIDEVARASIESLRNLCSFAAPQNINVIVENHGSYSSHGNWIKRIMDEVAMPNCGTLPDFGNFYDYDPLLAVKEMMPYAKGVSAKTNTFAYNGDENTIDYYKMLQIVKDAGYTGYIGIEYEGVKLDEDTGILKSKELLLKAAQYVK